MRTSPPISAELVVAVSVVLAIESEEIVTSVAYHSSPNIPPNTPSTGVAEAV